MKSLSLFSTIYPRMTQISEAHGFLRSVSCTNSGCFLELDLGSSTMNINTGRSRVFRQLQRYVGMEVGLAYVEEGGYKVDILVDSLVIVKPKSLKIDLDLVTRELMFLKGK